MVVALLEVLISRHNEVGSGVRAREFYKRTIGRIAHSLPAVAGLYKLGDNFQGSQELKGGDSRISKVWLQARTVQHFFEFRECGVTHDGDDIAPQDGIDDLGWRSRTRNQA